MSRYPNPRLDTLLRYETALFSALDSIPGGYPGGKEDRDRFVGPVETVLVDLHEQIIALKAAESSMGKGR